MKYALSGIILLLYFMPLASFCEESTAVTTTDRIINLPSKFFSRIQGKTAEMDKQFTEQKERYLAKMAKREERLRKRLYKVDSTAARNLFANSSQQYAALAQKLKTDTGSRTQSISGEYQPYTDSLRGLLNFLQLSGSTGPATASTALSPKMPSPLQSSISQLQALQAKMQAADQVNDLIQGQVAAGGAGGAAALQSNLQSAESQLDGFKDKLSKLGQGSGDIDMPDFKPNDQKTKTFWKRLEYGTNFQTTRNNAYFPTVTDLGLSVGYRLGNSNVVGVGASYKIGWGNGIRHIALSSNGIGLRSFLDIKIKGSFYLSGGAEYNYETPFSSYQQLKQWQYWTRSGLLAVTKIDSVKSRVFKKTKLQLLLDFLSYSQIPKTQAIIFRLGYNF